MHDRIRELYMQYRAAVYHLALSYLHDGAAAEDILQEVFITLLESKEPVRRPRAWLLTVIRRSGYYGD